MILAGETLPKRSPESGTAKKRTSAEEDAGEDGVGAGGGSHSNRDRAVGRDVDGDADPGPLREVGRDVGRLRSRAVVHADALSPAVGVPIQHVEVDIAAISGGEGQV